MVDSNGSSGASSTRLSRRTAFGLLGGGVSGLLGPLGIWSRPANAADGTLTIALPNNPATFDPINSANHDAMVVSQTIFENLVEVDLDGNLQPQLAVALPEISADRLAYTFELRDDVAFQNGKKFTPEDVKYSFEYLLNPANKSVRRALFEPIEAIKILDSNHVRVELKTPYRPWLEYLTKYMGIFPAGSREQVDANYFRAKPVGMGTGPGIFTEWRPNEYIELRKNPNYWRKGFPKWERLVVRIIPEDSTRLAYLSTGEVDIASAPPPKDFVRLSNSPNLSGQSVPALGGWFFLATNIKKPPFDDLNFRKALAHAIDRESIAKNVYYGLVDPASIPASPWAWWFDDVANRINSFDLAKAREYLKKSKYPNGAEVEMLVPSQPYLLDVKDAAVVIQESLAALNVRIRQKVVEQSVLLNQVGSGNHVSALQVWMSPGEPSFMFDVVFNPKSFLGRTSGYTNEAFQELIAKSLAEGDRDKLKAIFTSVMQMMASDCPLLWFGFVRVADLWRKSVKNFKANPALTINVAAVSKA